MVPFLGSCDTLEGVLGTIRKSCTFQQIHNSFFKVYSRFTDLINFFPGLMSELWPFK